MKKGLKDGKNGIFAHLGNLKNSTKKPQKEQTAKDIL
jgi:hypothetical protein